MRTWGWYALSSAGLVALASGCASRQEKTVASPVETAQGQSAQALEAASDAQKRASEQAKRAAEAREDADEAQAKADEAQQKLTEARAKAEQEQLKAQQLQREASQTTQAAMQQTQQSQERASQALEQRSRGIGQGEQTVSGFVARASGNELVVQPQRGGAMSFQVGADTQVRIDGREATAADIRQGSDARVAYDIAGGQAKAVRIEVNTGQPPGATPRTSGEVEGESSGTTSPSGPEPSGTGTTGEPGTTGSTEPGSIEPPPSTPETSPR